MSNADDTEPKLDIRIEVTTQAHDADSESYNFDQAVAKFYSTPNKKFMSHMIDTKQKIPTINCSRDGTKCATPVTDLQNHNAHVPTHTSMESLAEYVERIIKNIIVIAEKIDVKLTTTDCGNVHNIVVKDNKVYLKKEDEDNE